jgi:hypothetical protein
VGCHYFSGNGSGWADNVVGYQTAQPVALSKRHPESLYCRLSCSTIFLPEESLSVGKLSTEERFVCARDTRMDTTDRVLVAILGILVSGSTGGTIIINVSRYGSITIDIRHRRKRSCSNECDSG